MDALLNSAHWYEWIGGIAFVLMLVYLDFNQHDKNHHNKPPSIKESLRGFLFFVLAGVLFGVYVYFTRGAEMMGLFYTGFVLEKVLALDNLLVFKTIFTAFGFTVAARAHLQFKILLFGIMGAIVFRMLFLGGGSYMVDVGYVNASTAIVAMVYAAICWYGVMPASEDLHPVKQLAIGGIAFGLLALMLSYDVGTLVHTFNYQINAVMVIFAIIIGMTVKSVFIGEDDDNDIDYVNHWLANWLSHIIPVKKDIDSGNFFFNAKSEGCDNQPFFSSIKYGVTTSFIVLVLIEMSDIAFAFDSMPVIISVVKDLFIMFFATILAVCGLRNLYFMLDAVDRTFWLLHRGVGIVLGWITLKLLAIGFGFTKYLEHHYGIDEIMISMFSLAVVMTILVGFSVASVLIENPDKGDDDDDNQEATIAS